MEDRIGTGIGTQRDLRADFCRIGNITLVQFQQRFQDRIGKTTQTKEIADGHSSG